MKKWRYKGSDSAFISDVYSVGEERAATETEPARLAELKHFQVEVKPDDIFDAPDDWAPVPYPHPLFESVGESRGGRTRVSATTNPEEHE